MRPHKTELARQALQTHGGVLGMRERRLLILCDGQRDLAELTRLLGQDAPAQVRHLLEAGYLSAQASVAAPAAPAPAPTPAPVSPPAAVNSGPAAGPRRSRVAAKVYLLGMLELQRAAEAAVHRQRLQSRLDDAELIDALGEALVFLRTQVAPTLAARISERLREVLPEDDLPRLDTTLSAAA